MNSMHLYPPGTKIVIWGTSKIAQRAFYLYRERYNIAGFIDNNENGGTLLGKNIYRLSNLNKLIFEEKALIVIADERWLGLSKWMFKNGYKFLDHFIISDLFEYTSINVDIVLRLGLSDSELSAYFLRAKKNKKGFLIFGNCQVGVIKEYLIANERFNQEMILISIPEIHRFRADNISIVDNSILYQYVDILAIMKISPSNRIHPKFATDEFLKKIKPECQVIIIPNLWFTGYFPQMKKENDVNVLMDVFPNGFSKYGDTVLEQYLQKGLKSDEILKIIHKNETFTKEQIADAFQKALENVKEIDSHTDIKIGEWLTENYHKDILFYCPNHPKNYVLKEVTSRILRYLKLYTLEEKIVYKKEKILDSRESLKITTCSVYPDILHYLQLDYLADTLTYNPGCAVIDETMNFDDYIILYCLFSQ